MISIIVFIIIRINHLLIARNSQLKIHELICSCGRSSDLIFVRNYADLFRQAVLERTDQKDGEEDGEVFERTKLLFEKTERRVII